MSGPQLSQNLQQFKKKVPEQLPALCNILIIDETVYHIGASLKDLGKKLFAFSKMEALTGSELLAKM